MNLVTPAITAPSYLLFQSDITQSSLTLTCNPGTLTYSNLPSSWPVCVPYLSCSAPPLDPVVMTYDWTASKGTLPNVTVR